MKWFKVQILISWIVLAVTLVLLLVAHFGNWFSITTVKCQLNQGDCPDFVQAEVHKIVGQSLFSEWRAVPVRVTKLLPSYQLTKTTMNWPNQVGVEYQTLPVSYGVQSGNSPVLFIDQLGVVTEQPNPEVQKTLKIAQISAELYAPLQLRSALPETLHTSLSLLFHQQQLESENIQVEVISLNEIRVKMSSGHLYVLAASQIGKDISQLLFLEKSLSTQNLPAAAENPKEIDLRFKYPVLRTNTE